jgi:hypothetical protein
MLDIGAYEKFRFLKLMRKLKLLSKEPSGLTYTGWKDDHDKIVNEAVDYVLDQFQLEALKATLAELESDT